MTSGIEEKDFSINVSVEQRLVQACKTQDRKAQKELYLFLLPYLRAIASRYLRDDSYCKDVLQESYVKIFKNLDKFDASKASLKTWAAKIVINTSINFNKRVIDQYTEELKEDRPAAVPVAKSLKEITDDKLLSILKQMPQGYFEIFNLFVIDGYSHKEIKAILGISEALSRKKLSRARKWLQNVNPSLIATK